jgi:glyoxylase-like metal-dependent hydrolase (beta-lactamase superfamily II)/rhodanese-related sulfurtransferase
MDVSGIRTEGLGDTTYVLAHEGVALVVDPQRDIERFAAVIDGGGLDLALVLETHVHNDYVSGGRELAATFGASVVLPAASGASFCHVPAFHHEELTAGALRVRPIHTPGHTPEHTSYLVLVDEVPLALFSGGSLLVGAAGRTDLLGIDRARQLARLQHGSVMRLAGLPDDVGLYPTHGEGSFCTAGGAGRHTSTIGEERRTSPVLSFADAEAFAEAQLAGLQPYPTYYAHMGPLNLLAPPRPTKPLEEIAVGDLPGDAVVIDVREREAFAAGHLPGSLGIPASDAVGVWAGWLVPFDSSIVLVAGPDQELDEILAQFVRIGFDHVTAVVRDLGDAATAGYRTVAVPEAAAALSTDAPPVFLDVRAPNEWDAGHLEASRHCYVPDLATGLGDLAPGTEVWLGCRTGFRATIAAGIVEGLGLTPVVLDREGIAEVASRLEGG